MTERRVILRKISGPLVIVTSFAGNRATAAVISFITQTSIDPPMIVMAIRPESDLYAALTESKQAAIHFPRIDQKDLVAKFFKIRKWTDNSLNGYTFIISDRKNALLDEVPMSLEADIVDIIKQGDHHLFLCRISATHLENDYDTLNLSDTNWKYGG